VRGGDAGFVGFHSGLDRGDGLPGFADVEIGFDDLGTELVLRGARVLLGGVRTGAGGVAAGGGASTAIKIVGDGAGVLKLSIWPG